MPETLLKLIHVVRRYGPVGGMERYVWELTRELAALGYPVTVLCERCHAPKPPGITVVELGEIAARPRWLSYLRFGRTVSRWLVAHPHPGWLIHSHERLGVHHVTTFHGPPFASVRERPWWNKLSLRIWAQLYLERRELSVAQAILPNSEIIRRQLAHYYPEFADKLTVPVVPGVDPGPSRAHRAVPPEGGVIGFAGREWKRKGLPLAVEVVAALRQRRPELEFRVVGPRPEDIRHLFTDWHGGYQLLGWRRDAEYFRDFDVLLHPARSEPYGMVISEAMAASVPVVVSDACGAAAQVSADSGAVVSLAADRQQWEAAIEQQLQRRAAPPAFRHGWDAVARECEAIYRMLNGKMPVNVPPAPAPVTEASR
jgi:UDP-glucose:(heptosyl)LPS alpha-1,3-glucosyltransferase